MTPAVSVVIPTRDRGEALRQAVADALAQEGVEPELVVVDDGSREPVAEPLRALAGDRARVVRHEAPRGVARSRNAGVAAAAGEWVAFLDDDDRWAPDHLRRLLAVAGPGVAFAFSRHAMIHPDGTVISAGPDPDPEGMVAKLIANNPIVTPSSVLARRALVTEVGGFDPELSILADWDLWLRLAQRGRVVASRAVTVAYTQHPGGMHFDADGIVAEHRRLEAKSAALLGAHGRGLGDQLFWQWVAAIADPRRQRRLGALWYVRHQRGRAPASAIARGLVRLSRQPRLEPGTVHAAAPEPPALPWLSPG